MDYKIKQRIVLFSPLILAIAAWCFVFLRKYPDAGSQPYFYWTNVLFVLSTIVVLVAEYKWLKLRERTIRQIMMWLLVYVALFIGASQVFTHISYALLIFGAALSVLFVPIIILMTLFGSHPSFFEGRFSPILLAIIGGIWNIQYIVHWT